MHRAVVHAGRPLAEIDRTGHAIDGPIPFPEGAYLKSLFAIAPWRASGAIFLPNVLTPV